MGLQELDQLSPWLTHVHVFHWWPTSADRLPLEEGTKRWGRFLSRIKAIPGDRYALLEFARDNDPAIFLRDVAALRQMIQEA
jgi:sugar phosphate isomerase/epimerase